jgi:hypothetical protein
VSHHIIPHRLQNIELGVSEVGTEVVNILVLSLVTNILNE